jgi:thiamine-phosphate pyrophosphorylase
LLLPSLYLIADRETCRPRSLEDVLREALDAGIRLVQLREKDIADDALRRLAADVLDVASPYGARLLINSRPDIVMEMGSAGVHLPVRGPSPAAVREQAGPEFLIGCSTHSLDELRDAVEGGADLVTYSPVYEPTSKPGYGPPLGLDGLRQAARSTEIPVYALGGITPERVQSCRASGASGVAVMSGILAADDVGEAVRAYLRAWQDALPEAD